jgi:hypothetical protein
VLKKIKLCNRPPSVLRDPRKNPYRKQKVSEGTLGRAVSFSKKPSVDRPSVWAFTPAPDTEGGLYIFKAVTHVMARHLDIG